MHDENGKNTHNQKLLRLSEEQERPLFNVSNTVKMFQLDRTPPSFVLDTLAMGPRNPVSDRFDPKDVFGGTR